MQCACLYDKIRQQITGARCSSRQSSCSVLCFEKTCWPTWQLTQWWGRHFASLLSCSCLHVSSWPHDVRFAGFFSGRLVCPSRFSVPEHSFSTIPHYRHFYISLKYEPALGHEWTCNSYSRFVALSVHNLPMKACWCLSHCQFEIKKSLYDDIYLYKALPYFYLA